MAKATVFGREPQSRPWRVVIAPPQLSCFQFAVDLLRHEGIYIRDFSDATREESRLHRVVWTAWVAGLMVLCRRLDDDRYVQPVRQASATALEVPTGSWPDQWTKASVAAYAQTYVKPRPFAPVLPSVEGGIDGLASKLSSDLPGDGRTLVLAPVAYDREALLPIPSAGVIVACVGGEWVGPTDALVEALRAAARA